MVRSDTCLTPASLCALIRPVLSLLASDPSTFVHELWRRLDVVVCDGGVGVKREEAKIHALLRENDTE